MVYGNILFDKEEIPQEELNAEEKTRTNLFAWNGQFTPQFVESLVKTYAKKDYIVIDTFSGSGTTLYECARQGISSFGIELNVSAYYISKFYELCNLSSGERLKLISTIENIISNISTNEMVLTVLKNTIKYDSTATVINIISLLLILMDIYNKEVSIDNLQKKMAENKEIPYRVTILRG